MLKLTLFVLYHVLVFFRDHQAPSAVFFPAKKKNIEINILIYMYTRLTYSALVSHKSD